MKITISGIMLTLLLTGMLTPAFNLAIAGMDETASISSPLTSSEPPATEWNKTYGGIHGDIAWSVVQTGDGGYALTGYTHSFGAGESDFWLVKTDSAGNMQWNKTYGGTSYEFGGAYSMVQTSDGGYALTGSTLSYGAGAYDGWLVKTDSSGNVEWNQTYGGANSDFSYSVVQTHDGGYALTGVTSSYGVGGDAWLIKLAPETLQPDLSVVSIEPIQVIADASALLMNKKTALRVHIQSTFSVDVNIAYINVTYDFGRSYHNQPYQEKGADGIGITIKPGINRVYIPGGPICEKQSEEWVVRQDAWNPPEGADFHFEWTTTGLDDNIKVTIPAVQSETNPDNNELTINKQFHDTESLSIAYYKVQPLWPANYGTPSWSEYSNTVNKNTEFITATYPISQDKLTGQSKGIYLGSWIPSTYPLYVGLLYDLASLSFWGWLSGADRGVGVVSDAYFPYHSQDARTVGIMSKGIRGAALIREGYWIAAAHEIGHTYGLCLDVEEYDANPPGNRADGFWVSKRREITNGLCFMGYSPSKHTFDYSSSRSSWICNECFDYLWDELTVSASSGMMMSEQKAVFVRGYIYRNGTAELENLYILEDMPTLDPEPGNYSINLVDFLGQTLSETSFEPSFKINVDPIGIIETDVACFSFALQWPENASKIQITYNGSTILNKPITAHVPSVQVTYPNGGETLTAGTNQTITWKASDLDGDTLAYTLTYSSDGGESWIPLEIDVEGNSYVWNTSHLDKGSNYLVRVIATDGVNTVEDVSDSTFTVKVHDVAVTDVTPSKTIVGQCCSMNINVTVENQGDYTETFDVTVFFNETAIILPNGKNHTTITLTSGNSTTVIFTWNTTGWAKGNYTMSAYVAPVQGETDLSDNNSTGGWVFVTIQGDVDGDRDVDIYDVVKITGIYGSKRGDPQFNPNSDLDDDGEIKIYDVVRCTSHYGQSW